MANIFVAATATWNGKALKKAKKDVDVFNKQLKGLARTFGVTFGAAALVSFSKKAIKAFTEDEAAARRLALQLENTGNAFRVDEVEGYIKSLEKTNAILTDLRAPFQTLLNLTGSVELAQRSLESALNISAGTGENLNTVISAISSGIRGQTKAIKNLNTGIDANIIASGDMNKIMEALDKRFSGQAAARLDTYAGKMDVLKKGADEATKAIGTGLVDALSMLGKDNSINDAAEQMENFGTAIGNAIAGLAELIRRSDKLIAVNNEGKLGDVLLSLQPGGGAFKRGLSQLINFGASSRTAASPGLNNANARENRLQLAQIKKGTTYRKLENEQLKKKTEVDKLSEKFDLERIGLMKALSEATDAETKLRIQAKLAILDNNEALAKKYNAELLAKSAADLLAEAFDQTATAIRNFGPALFDAMGNITGRGRSQLAPLEGQSFNYTVPQGVTNQGAMGAATAPTVVNVPVNAGTIVTNQELQGLITDTVRVALKSGNKLLPAGGIS